MADYIEDVFGANGILSRTLPGYMPRVGQIELARATDRALVNGGAVLAEAPTGTGKSIAYAVPAVHHTAKTGKRQRVAIVTANIALQEQLCVKDLPFLQSALPWQFAFALVKGRSNYLCLDRFDRRADMKPADLAEWRSELRLIETWAGTTQAGDVSELTINPPPRLWAELSVGADECKGKRCPSFDRCFVEAAKRKAAAAHVIVANYHLVFADLMVRAATEGHVTVIPPFDAVVLDEGHRAADIARDFFGFKVSEHACRRLVTNAMRALREGGFTAIPGDLAAGLEAIEREAERFFGSALAHAKGKEYRARLRDPNEVDPAELVRKLEDVGRQFADLAARTGGEFQITAGGVGRKAMEHAANLRAAASLHDAENVYFLEENGGTKRPWVAVGSKPIEVADRLRDDFFAPLAAKVVTSATLTVGGSFDHVACEIGIEEAEEVVAPSPFDFARQALLVVPEGLPDPTDRAYPEAVAEAVAETIDVVRGRTLALFTSYAVLERTANKLGVTGGAGMFKGYRIMRQGEAPRTQLIQMFRDDVSSCLLGTASFWEGVDVPGEACSCVVIDRLPFPSPDDPVLDVVAARDPRGWFARWSLPRSVIAFRQGFGRLIRTVSDRGVVVLLDRRVITKSYGRTFIRSLPPGLRVSRSIGDARAMLDGGAR